MLAHSTAIGGRAQVERDFQIVKFRKHKESEKTLFYYHTLRGTERTNNSLNRLSMLSENQSDYPLPESGCAPTAMLNILVWYEKYGLIQPDNRDSDLGRYKSRLFQEIDDLLKEQPSMARTDDYGVGRFDAAMVMEPSSASAPKAPCVSIPM